MSINKIKQRRKNGNYLRFIGLYNYALRVDKLYSCTICGEIELQILTSFARNILISYMDTGIIAFPNEIKNGISVFDVLRRPLDDACDKNWLNKLINCEYNYSRPDSNVLSELIKLI